jgi:IS30 family transposase
VSREVARHGGRPLYRASEADRQAWNSALRPKVCLLAIEERLRTIVASKLILDWSPEQISKWLKVHYSNNESMRVSHETIYRSLFIQARGVLKKRAGSAPQVQAAYTSLTALARCGTVPRADRRCHLY